MGNQKYLVKDIAALLGIFLSTILFSTALLMQGKPVIMQDEYVYQQSALFGSLERSQAYGNFAFNLIYGQTALCSENFYACAKSLNSVFFAGLACFTFLIFRLHQNTAISALIAASVVLSPFQSYVSFFMPEIMFACLATGAMYWLILAQKTYLLKHFLISGVFLGLAVSTKFHGYFVLLGLAVAVILGENFRWSSRLTNKLAALLSASFGTRFLMEWLDTGQIRWNPVPSGYFSKLSQDMLTSYPTETLVALGELGSMQVPTHSVEISMFNLTLSFLLLIAAIFVVSGGTFNVLAMRQSNLHLSETKRVFTSVLASLFVMTFLFGIYATYMGDNHLDRPVLRYMEFLIVPMIALSVIVLNENRHLLSPIKILFLVPGTTLLSWALLQMSNPTFADSPWLYSLRNANVIELAVILLVLSTLLFISTKTKREIFKVITTVLISSLATFNYLSDYGSLVTSAGDIDMVGERARVVLEDAAGSEILIAGKNFQRVTTVGFYLQKPGLTFEIIESGSLFDLNRHPHVRYVVMIDGVGAKDSPPYFLRLGSAGVILGWDRTSESSLDVASSEWGTIADFGLSSPSTSGRWLTEGRARLVFAKLPRSVSFKLSIASSLASEKPVPVEFRVGEESLVVTIEPGGSIMSGVISFNNKALTDEVEITVLDSNPNEKISLLSLEMVN